MKKPISWMFAIVSTVVLMMGATSAMAKHTSTCFQTKNGKSYLAIDKNGYLNASAKSCSGPAIFQLSDYSKKPGQSARLNYPSHIRAANGKYVRFWGNKMRAVAPEARHNTMVLQWISTANPRKNRPGSTIKVGQQVTLMPMRARGRLNLTATRGGGKDAVNTRRARAGGANTFTLVAPPAKTVKACFMTDNGQNFLAINKRGYVHAEATVCKGGAIFEISDFTQSPSAGPRIHRPSHIRAANGKYVRFWGSKLRAVMQKPLRKSLALTYLRPADKKTRPWSFIKLGNKVRLVPAQTRGRLNVTAFRGGGADAFNRRAKKPGANNSFTLVKPGTKGLEPPKLKTVSACFMTQDRKNFLSIDKKSGMLQSEATHCSGGAVFDISHYSQKPNQPPRMNVPSYIRAANGRYLTFHGSTTRATSKSAAWNRRMWTQIFSVDGKLRGGALLKVGQKVHLKPASARGRLSVMADDYARVYNSRWGRKDQKMFTLVKPGTKGFQPPPAKNLTACFKTGDGKHFVAIDKNGFMNATSTTCSGNAVFQITDYSQSPKTGPRTSVPSAIRAANGKYVTFWGSRLRAWSPKYVRGSYVLSYIRSADNKVKRGKPLEIGHRVTLFPARARGRLNYAAIRGGGKDARNVGRRRSPDKEITFLLTAP
jgi:hypothetical protein